MTTPLENGASAGLATRAAALPQRELRLLVDAVREWLSSLGAKNRAPGFWGVLEGQPGQGRLEILGALRDLCLELGIRVVSGRNFTGGAIPPGPIASMVSEGLSILGRKEAQSADARVLAELEKPAWDVSPCDVPALGAELHRSRLVDAIARTLLKLCDVGPVLILLEELPLADELTVESLRQLSRMLWLKRERGEEPRVLFIATVPEGGKIDEFLGSPDIPLKEMELFRILARGYSREDLREITFKLLGKETPLSFREKMFRLTRGNVRHIRWLLWHIREMEAQPRETPSFLDLSFPEIVERRYQALSEEEQRTVCALVALGSACPGPWVESVVHSVKRAQGTPLDALLRKGQEACPGGGFALESLVEKGWARALRPRRSDGGVSYAIADADVAKVLLAGFEPGKKKNLHGAWGVELHEHAEENASWFPHAFWQFRLAGEGKMSVETFFLALDFLASLGCFNEALKMIQEPLEELPGLGEDIQRELKLKRAGLLESASQYQQAIKIYRDLGDRGLERKSYLHRRAGDVYGKMGEREAQVEEYKAGLLSLELEEKSPERLHLLCALAKVHLEIDQLDESEHYLDESNKILANGEAFSDKDRLEATRIAQALSFRQRDYEAALRLEQSILELERQIGDEASQVKAFKRLAHLHALREGWQESEVCLTHSLEVARQSGSRWLFAKALYSMGLFHRDRRNLELALQYLLKARGIFEDLGKRDEIHAVTSALFGLELELGHFHGVGKKALTFIQGWLTAKKGAEERDSHALALLDAQKRGEWIQRLEHEDDAGKSPPREKDRPLILGRMLEDEGRLKDAQRVYRGCLQGDPLSGSPLRSRAFHSLARIAALTGDDDSALRCLEEGLEFRGTSPSRAVLADAYIEVSAIFLGRGDFSRSIDYGVRGFKLSVEVGGLEPIVRALLGLSEFLIEAGVLSAAADVARGTAQLAHKNGLLRWEIVACRELVKAITLGLEEEIPEGILPRWLELCELLKCPLETARLKLELGWVRYREEAFQDALRLAREGIEIARSIGFSPLIDELLHLVGVVESAFTNPRKNFLRALEGLEQALLGAEARRRPRLRWEVLHALAALYRRKGKSDLAEEFEERAKELKRAVSSTLPHQGLSELCWRPRLEIVSSTGSVRSKPAFTA